MSLSSDFEAFIITNGRKTFDIALKCLENQSVPCKITQIRDMIWVDAVNLINEKAECPYYLRVDDDFFLHPRAAEYIINKIIQFDYEKTAAYVCNLYEPAERMPVRGVKMYNTKIARDLGFRANELGKIDKNFRHDISKNNYKMQIDKSVVGIHANSDKEDELKYRKLWKDIAPQHHRKLVVGKESLKKQEQMIYKKLPNLNKKTSFREFL